MFRARQVTRTANAAAHHPRTPITILRRQRILGKTRGAASAATQLMYFTGSLPPPLFFPRIGLYKYNYRPTIDVAAPSLRVSPAAADESYVEFLSELQPAIANN